MWLTLITENCYNYSREKQILISWLGSIYSLPIFLMDAVILYSTKQLLDNKLTNRHKYVRWIYLSGLVALIVIIVMLISIPLKIFGV